ncbi:MAG: hypothetical protein AABN95_19035 [Acidobacteriota bacterium]
MKRSFQSDTRTQMLSAITLFCYSASFAGLFAIGYALIVFVLHVAGQQIGSMYSPHGF